MNEKIKLHRMEPGDGNALLAPISELRRKAVAESGVDVIVVSCFEAGRDGFWLHRLLLAHGVINHVVEPTSILVTRGARRAKTDRLDAQGLLRVLAAIFTGDHDACRVVNVVGSHLGLRISESESEKPLNGFFLTSCCGSHYAGSRRARRSSGPARPSIVRFSAFKRLICPSVWPLLQGSVIAFLTASMSLCAVRAKRCIAYKPDF